VVEIGPTTVLWEDRYLLLLGTVCVFVYGCRVLVHAYLASNYAVTKVPKHSQTRSDGQAKYIMAQSLVTALEPVTDGLLP